MLDLDLLRKEYINKVYSYLTVIDVFRKSNTIFFKCRCVCGKIINVRKTRIINSVTTSCGCYKKSKEFSDRQRQWSKDHSDITNRNVVKLRLWHENDSDRKKDIISNNDYSDLLEILHPKYTEDFLNGKITSNSIVETRCPACDLYVKHKLSHVYMFNSRKFRRDHIIMCRKCAFSYTSSKYETEIADYISTFYNGECIRNSREIISPLELDLYYPEKKIAIEFNGDYWHDENHKSKDYHYNKFKQCYDKGIVLVSIFEYFWNKEYDSIKQYIRDLFSGIYNKISFNCDKSMMNNNYPTLNVAIGEYRLEHFYTSDKFKVYTCGFSEIV